jgi:hypothetical protein
VKNVTITVKPDPDGKGVVCEPNPTKVFHSQTVTWVMAGVPDVTAHFEPTTPFVEPGPFPPNGMLTATVKKLPPLKKGEVFPTHFKDANGHDVKTNGDIIIGG